MPAENMEISVESQNFVELRSKKKKHIERNRKQLRKKERSFSGPKRCFNTY